MVYKQVSMISLILILISISTEFSNGSILVNRIYLEADPNPYLSGHRMIEARTEKTDNEAADELPKNIVTCYIFGDKNIISVKIEDAKKNNENIQKLNRMRMTELTNLCHNKMIKKDASDLRKAGPDNGSNSFIDGLAIYPGIV